MSKTEGDLRGRDKDCDMVKIEKRLPCCMKWFIKGPVAVGHVNVEGSEEW